MSARTCTQRVICRSPTGAVTARPPGFAPGSPPLLAVAAFASLGLARVQRVRGRVPGVTGSIGAQLTRPEESAFSGTYAFDTASMVARLIVAATALLVIFLGTAELAGSAPESKTYSLLPLGHPRGNGPSLGRGPAGADRRVLAHQHRVVRADRDHRPGRRGRGGGEGDTIWPHCDAPIWPAGVATDLLADLLDDPQPNTGPSKDQAGPTPAADVNQPVQEKSADPVPPAPTDRGEVCRWSAR